VQTLAQIRALLNEYGLAPKKSLGQNFLIDHNLLRKLVDAAEVGKGDLVLEIGPGTGTLTEELLDRGCQVIASELDAGLCALLRNRFGQFTNFALIEGDCLASKRALAPALCERLAGRRFSLVANLPYGAGTPLILVLLTRHPECRGLFVTLQSEVAQRIMAAPGSEDYGAISVVSSACAQVTKIATLAPTCFWPRPGVESTMLAMVRRPNPLASDLISLAETTQRVFTQRRKQLAAACRNLGWTPPPDIPPTRRVYELTCEELVKLAAWVDKV